MYNRQKKQYSSRVQTAKAIAHHARWIIIEQLSKKEHNVSQLQKIVSMKMPTVSRHLKILQTAGLIEEIRKGQNVYYRLAKPEILSALRTITKL